MLIVWEGLSEVAPFLMGLHPLSVKNCDDVYYNLVREKAYYLTCELGQMPRDTWMCFPLIPLHLLLA